MILRAGSRTGVSQVVDALIAATERLRVLTAVTRNVKDMEFAGTRVFKPAA